MNAKTSNTHTIRIITIGLLLLGICCAPAHAQFVTACCLPGQLQCKVIDGPLDACQMQGGVNMGAFCFGVNCASVLGACCLGGIGCVNLQSPSSCADLGGSLLVGQSCESVLCNSCQGNCGEQAPSGCGCDPGCFGHEIPICCADVCDYCDCPHPQCSCEGNCGGSASHYCSCDAACFALNDCCLDVCEHCDFGELCVGSFCEIALTGVGTFNATVPRLATASCVSDSCAIAENDYWFEWTADCTGTATVAVCATDEIPPFHSIALSAFTDCPSKGGAEFACSSTHPSGFCNAKASALLSWQAEKGQTYHIRLSGVSSGFVPITFECDPDEVPPIGACCTGEKCEQLTKAECVDECGAFLGGESACGPCNACAVWNPLAGGTNNTILALASYNGDVIASGDFTAAGCLGANRVARWDGSQWHPLGSGFNGSVFALHVFEGDLIAAGDFTHSGPVLVNHIARWDGVAWQPFVELGAVGVNGLVRALTVHEGDLIVGGSFTMAGPMPASAIARWDGSTWDSLGVGVGGLVYALATYDGALVAGGELVHAGGLTVNNIARWDGAAWSTLDDGVDHAVAALMAHEGDLIVGGTFIEASGLLVRSIARWDGTSWHAFDDGGNVGVIGAFGTLVADLAIYNGDLVAAGFFHVAGSSLANHVARWDGEQWSPFDGGTDWAVSSLLVHEGELIAAGMFDHAGGLAMNAITRWRDCSAGECGSADAGDCFTVGGAACDDQACCDAVCATDPFCCNQSWDDACVMQATSVCAGSAGECGSPLSGPCDAPNSTPGCENDLCCQEVCAAEPACCDPGGGGWSSDCAALATTACVTFLNTGGAGGTIVPGVGLLGLFEMNVVYSAGSILDGTLCCNLDELPETVGATFVIDVFDGIGTSPGLNASLANVVSFNFEIGTSQWTELLNFDVQLAFDGPTSPVVTDLTWLGERLDIPCDPNDPFGPTCEHQLIMNFPLTFKSIDPDTGEIVHEYLYTQSAQTLTPVTCLDIGCCEGRCGGASPAGCACDAGCFDRGDCCADVCVACALAECAPSCLADLTGNGSVGVPDLLELLSQWGPCPNPQNCPADLTGNGSVAVPDLLEMLSQWGPCP